MSIRPFTPDDLAACVDLYIRVYAEPPWNEEWPHKAALAHFVQSTGTPGFFGWVATNEQGDLIGVLTGFLKPAIHGYVFFMEDLFVGVAQQRQGIASDLTKTLQDWLHQRKGLGIALLTLRQAPALAFYHQQGFTEHQELAYLMWQPPAKRRVSQPRKGSSHGK